jgi:hypothetical protein
MEINKETLGIVQIVAWVGLGLFITAFLLASALVDPSMAVYVRDFFYTVMGVVTVSALIAAAAKSHGRDKRVWRLIATAGVLWALGDLTVRVCEVLGLMGPKRVLSYPDIFFLAAYVALIAIVVLLGIDTKKPGLKKWWIRVYPPSVVVLSILISLGMAVFLPRGVGGGPIGAYSLDLSIAINYFYTAIDFCIISGLLLIILLNNTHFNRLWEALFVLGLSTFSIADLSSSLFIPAGIYNATNLPTQIIMAIWLTGYGLLAMSAFYNLTRTPSVFKDLHRISAG